MNDLISRQAAINAMRNNVFAVTPTQIDTKIDCIECVEALPPAQPEQLTDKEQRIFLAAMSREEKVCEEVDRNFVREPYEDSLMSVCREIKRKVKGALWT